MHWSSDSDKENQCYHAPATEKSSGDAQAWYTPETCVQSALPTATTFCESPFDMFCQCWCRAANDTNDYGLYPDANLGHGELADVISLGACKDSEVSWEEEDGMSMTRALVRRPLSLDAQWSV